MAGAFTDEKELVKEALRLIDQGWSQISSLSAPKRDVIFVLGGTGAGKSTVTQIITGKLSDLTSKPGQHGSGLIIVDEPVGNGEGRIGDPRVASKTFLPEYLLCEDDPSLVFVDCPGFNDNRGTHMDIAAMVLIKKIAENVDHARFLFVTPSSSVSYSNINRNDFSLLCTHATSFITNLNKVKDSMSLIVTKVNNCDPSTGQLIEDPMIVNETSIFLTEVAGQGSTTLENRQFIENLLQAKSHWALIRFPNKPGPLHELEHFVKVRKSIQEMCKKLRRASVSSCDFAITLAADSKYIITKRLVPHMKGEIEKIVKAVLSGLEFTYLSGFQRKVQSHETEVLVSLLQDLGAICEKLKDADVGMNRNGESSKVLKTIAGWLQVELGTGEMGELGKLEEQLRVFQQVTQETDTQPSVVLAQSVSSLRTGLEDLYKATVRMVKDVVVRNLESQTKDEGLKILATIDKQYAQGFWDALQTGDGYGRDALMKLEKDWAKYERMDDQCLDKLSVTFLEACVNLNVPLPDLNNLKRLENDLMTLLELTDLAGRAMQMSVVPEIRKSIRTLRIEVKDKVRDKFVKNVNEKIQQKLDQSIHKIQDIFFREVFYPNLSLATLGEKLRLLKDVFDLLQGFGVSGRNVNEIVGRIHAMYAAFGADMPESDETELTELVSILDFYDQVLGSVSPRPMSEWLRGVRTIEERLRDMTILYEYVEHAKCTNPNTVDEDLLLGEASGDIISHILNVLRATPEVCRIVQESAKEQDKLLIKELAKYIESGKTNLNAGEGQRLVVKGREVKFSDFLNDTGMPQNITNVLVMASEKVTIDKDLNGTGKQMVLTVIANKWDVKGFRTIHLGGVDGPPHSDKKATNGREYGAGGKHGLPGNCGTNGGHFIGVYNVLGNGQNLAVYTDGGNGGPGQAGGDGYEGKAGRDAVPTDLEVPALGTVGNWFGRFGTRVASTILPNLKVNGKGGSKGGCGGDGGAGGKPGQPGTIQLLSMSNPVPIGTMSYRPGNPGQPGDGGCGGRGGKHGNDLEFTSLTRYIVSGDGVVEDHRRGASGNDGARGGNTSGQRNPPTQSSVKLDWQDVEQFRNYIMEECQGQKTSGHLILDLMHSHPGIIESHQQFGLISLCTHLSNLELCFYRHSPATGVVSSALVNEYQRYQRRLLRYASNLSPSDLASQHHLLNILYAACLSKMIVLREQKESSTTVVNVYLYLKSLSSRITELESLSVQQWRLDHFNDFQAQMDGKICQLEAAINVTTTQYLGQLEKTLFDSLNQAIYREQVQLQAQVGNRQRNNCSSTGELFIMSKIFEGISTAASFVSLFGKVATSIYGFLKSAPAVVKGIAEAIKSKDFLKNLGKFCIQNIMQSEFVRDLTSSIADSVKSVRSIVTQVNTLLGGQASPEILQTLGKISKGLQNLENIGKGDKINFFGRLEAMAAMEKHVGDLMSTIMHTKDKLLKSGKEAAKAVVGNLDKILRMLLITTSKTRVISCQDNTQLPVEMIQAIINLEQKKQSIYTETLPAINTIMTDLGSLSSCQSENNSIPRIMAKWKLAMTMDKLRTSLTQFVESTNALNNPDICQCLSQINAGISMTIELYEEIAKFEDTKRLACFIKNVASCPTPEATIEDVELQKAFLKARFLVKTNLFLVDWVIAVKAFKQWAFPFAEKWFPVQDHLTVAHEHIAKVLSGEDQTIEENIATVAQMYAEKYGKLVSIFQDYRATAPEIDQVLFIKEFNETQPLFRWKSEDHGGAIKAFLLGKRVTFTADVWKSPWQQNAVNHKLGAMKFKNIHIGLTVSNPERNHRLSNLLKTFRVTMTHSGVSHYVVNGQEFILKSRSQPEFSYSFDKRTKNLVCIKSENDGDYLHSPYTDWTLKLSPMETENMQGGNELEEFLTDDIDLTLCGNGSFIDENDITEKGLDSQLFKNLSIHYQPDN